MLARARQWLSHGPTPTNASTTRRFGFARFSPTCPQLVSSAASCRRAHPPRRDEGPCCPPSASRMYSGRASIRSKPNRRRVSRKPSRVRWLVVGHFTAERAHPRGVEVSGSLGQQGCRKFAGTSGTNLCGASTSCSHPDRPNARTRRQLVDRSSCASRTEWWYWLCVASSHRLTCLIDSPDTTHGRSTATKPVVNDGGALNISRSRVTSVTRRGRNSSHGTCRSRRSHPAIPCTRLPGSWEVKVRHYTMRRDVLRLRVPSPGGVIGADRRIGRGGVGHFFTVSWRWHFVRDEVGGRAERTVLGRQGGGSVRFRARPRW